MKKKIVSFLLAMMICVSGLFSQGFETKAEDDGEEMDFSYLMTEDALVGYAQSQTWGVYLVEGYSIINRISSTKIGAGGVTNASRLCKVSVCPIVEKLSGGSWVRVTSWTVTEASDYSAMASRSITVATGYYYRVRCLHSAASDGSSSCTSAMWM